MRGRVGSSERLKSFDIWRLSIFTCSKRFGVYPKTFQQVPKWKISKALLIPRPCSMTPATIRPTIAAILPGVDEIERQSPQ